MWLHAEIKLEILYRKWKPGCLLVCQWFAWPFLSPSIVFAPNCCFFISTLLISQPYVEYSQDKAVSNEDSCKIETFLSEAANRG